MDYNIRLFEFFTRQNIANTTRYRRRGRQRKTELLSQYKINRRFL